MKHKIAIVRGKFLNRYEMQFFEPLVKRFDITGFGSWTCYHDTFAFPVVKLLSPADVPDFPYKMSILNRLFIDAHYLFGLESRLRGYDLVHTAETYFHYTAQCLDAKRKGYVKKVVATVLENIPYNNESIWGRKSLKAAARQELDHIIALTNKTKDALVVEGADPEKITIIPHFVDTKRFFPRAHRKSSFLIILYAGRLEEHKGVFDVLDAARILVQDPELVGYALKFMFVGDGSRKPEMQIKERTLGLESHVIHRSIPYNDMPQVYQLADIFVAPSKAEYRYGRMTWEEQYNTSLLEAQASGLAIVTTRSGGIPENVGDAAMLINPGEVAELTRVIKRFILNRKLRAEFGHRARHRALTVHDAKIGAGKIADLYEHVLAQP
ncbi:glycosyltransferase family 4 protein [Candidatus Gottesmanbacteria bacterium]|nr:glycosyltransferase family 4 protein [Candidatus Gottesmanbacteria bacterium]